jgi:hypothetical protein
MRNRSICLAAARRLMATAFAAATFALPAAAQAPDTALVNGKIITLDAHAAVAEAVAVRDSKIVQSVCVAAMDDRRPHRRRHADARCR